MALLVYCQPNRLRLGEILQRSLAMLAAEARLTRAAPGQTHVRITVSVDPNRAGLQARRHPVDAANVGTPDTRRKTVGRAVRHAKRILLIIERNDTQDGTEDFLLRDPHLVGNVGK